MSGILDLLLRPEIPNVQKQLPEKRVKLKRLSTAEEGVIFTLHGLPYVAVHILLAGCGEPNLKDPALMEKYGAATPVEAVKCLLLPGEIEDLSREVEKLCGYRRRTIDEVKNG